MSNNKFVVGIAFKRVPGKIIESFLCRGTPEAVRFFTSSDAFLAAKEHIRLHPDIKYTVYKLVEVKS